MPLQPLTGRYICEQAVGFVLHMPLTLPLWHLGEVSQNSLVAHSLFEVHDFGVSAKAGTARSAIASEVNNMRVNDFMVFSPFKVPTPARSVSQFLHRFHDANTAFPHRVKSKEAICLL